MKSNDFKGKNLKTSFPLPSNLSKSPSLIKNKEKTLSAPKLKSEVNTREIELPTITPKESHKHSQLEFVKV